MQDITLFFQLGWRHIISIDATDHLLFLSALVAVYQINDWKKILILVTAFTIGHTATLVLSVTDLVRFNSHWVEFLIPVTIVFTAANNILGKTTFRPNYRYLMALAFGLIHGMGFASTLIFMLADNQSLAIPMLSFNVGIETGQMLVVVILVIISSVFVNLLRFPQCYWNLMVSSLTGIWALVLSVLLWPL